MVSNFQEYYKLVRYLTRYNTGAQLALVLGANSLINVFNEKFYENLNGGLMEAFGYLFHKDVRLYLYPYRFGDEVITSENMIITEKYEELYNFLKSSGKIIDYEKYDSKTLDIFSHKVLEKITEGNKEWEEMVPPIVARLIKENNLFNFRKRKFSKSKMSFR